MRISMASNILIWKSHRGTVIWTELEVLMPSLLAIESAYPTRQTLTVQVDDDPLTGLSLEDYFQHFVLEHQDQMSETELAQKLGISRKTLWERRQRLGIPRRR